MPTFYGYQSDPGGYIQTTIDGDRHLLEVSPSAQSLLNDLEFEYGDHVPRDITKPLIILGVLETKTFESSKRHLLSGIPTLSSDYCELDADQQATLREYILQRVDDLTNADYSLLTEFIETESPLESLSRQAATADDITTATDTTDQSWSASTTSPEPTPDTTAWIDDSTEVATSTCGIDLTAIPDDLRSLDQWLGWRSETRDDKPTKVPVSPHDGTFAKVNDASTWGSFEIAVDALSRSDIDGLGFVFTDEDTIAGVDLDDIRDPDTGTLTEKAEEIVATLNSYAEVSPSGTGLHILLHGFVPAGGHRNDGIEIYDSGRFFTVTGEHVASTPADVEVRHHELASVHETHVVQDIDTTSSTELNKIDTPDVTPRTVNDLSANQVIEYGQRSRTFRQLWDGDTSGYESHSEADMALCVLLSYYTGDDVGLIDSLFRRSGLMRTKWDEQRGEQTYGELTIQNAIEVVDTYDPHLHGMEAAAPEVDISQLTPENKATIEATVDQVESVPADAIDQAGDFTDDTGRIRFVVWESEYWDIDTRFKTGETYRLADAWVTEYQGQRQIQINEHTAVENV